MNSSQLLYKISDLQYNIRMREAEYARAINAGKQPAIEANSTSLAHLRAELAALVTEYNSIPVASPQTNSKSIEKTPWWQSFLNAIFPRTNK